MAVQTEMQVGILKCIWTTTSYKACVLNGFVLLSTTLLMRALRSKVSSWFLCMCRNDPKTSRHGSQEWPRSWWPQICHVEASTHRANTSSCSTSRWMPPSICIVSAERRASATEAEWLRCWTIPTWRWQKLLRWWFGLAILFIFVCKLSRFTNRVCLLLLRCVVWTHSMFVFRWHWCCALLVRFCVLLVRLCARCVVYRLSYVKCTFCTRDHIYVHNACVRVASFCWLRFFGLFPSFSSCHTSSLLLSHDLCHYMYRQFPWTSAHCLSTEIIVHVRCVCPPFFFYVFKTVLSY